MIYGGHFDLDKKISRREELDKIINSVDFWNSSNKDNDLKEFNNLNNLVNDITNVKNRIESNVELLNEEIDNDMLEVIDSEYEDINKDVHIAKDLLKKQLKVIFSTILKI